MSDTQKTAAEMLEALGKPFPKTALKQRKGGGGRSFTYVETHTVIHRLNSATNGWDFHIKDVQWRNDVLIVQGELTIHGLGTRSGFGVQQVVERAGEDLVKGAASDALKKCATLFGVALELYGSDYEANEPTGAPQKATQAPQRNDKAPVDLMAQTVNAAGLKKLHAVLAGYGLTHDHLTAYAVDQGHESSKQLTNGQGKKLVDGLEKNTDAAVKYLQTLANKMELEQVGMEVGQMADQQGVGK